jgi:hypothetical protein
MKRHNTEVVRPAQSRAHPHRHFANSVTHGSPRSLRSALAPRAVPQPTEAAALLGLEHTARKAFIKALLVKIVRVWLPHFRVCRSNLPVVSTYSLFQFWNLEISQGAVKHERLVPSRAPQVSAWELSPAVIVIVQITVTILVLSYVV